MLVRRMRAPSEAGSVEELKLRDRKQQNQELAFIEGQIRRMQVLISAAFAHSSLMHSFRRSKPELQEVLLLLLGFPLLPPQ